VIILIVFARNRDLYKENQAGTWSRFMPKEFSSRLPKFNSLTFEQRLEKIVQVTGLGEETKVALRGDGGLALERADYIIENVVGVFGLPLGIATNFIINGRQVLVPMVVEEPSVVAGASYMAKLVRADGGFTADTTESEMIGQIQVLDVPDMEKACHQLQEHKSDLLTLANQIDKVIISLGGGARDLEIRILQDTAVGSMLVVHLIFDTRDAMGANTVNSAVELLAPEIEELTGGRVHLRIVTNLADRRRAHARCRIPTKELAFDSYSGDRVRDGIVEAWAFAAADPYRASTHNKGIMNGIDAVLIATGNDWRAVEAGAHAYAARSGRYTSLSRWWVSQDGALEGELDMPMAVGIVGGATQSHPAAKACLRLMSVKSARELAEIIVSVGLAQNLAALRALATEGIQRGHMKLHARQVAIAAGAQGDLINRVAQQLVSEGAVLLERAEELIRDWTK
jgi:hydroxymethylglutaryl-CoA reductase